MQEYLWKKEALISLLQDKKLFLTKNRGQNFLIDLNIREKLASYLPPKVPYIVEIGAGLGHWTYFLRHKTQNLICVEVDNGFIPILRASFPEATIIHQDFLKLNLSDLIKEPSIPPFVVCGNIPYLLSTKICEHILNFPALPDQIFFTVEKDFALEKLLNPVSPLNKKLTYFYNIQLLNNISKFCFFPAPKKDSAFIEMQAISPKTVDSVDYLNFIDNIFKNPKKTIFNNLATYNLPLAFWEDKEHLKNLRVHQLDDSQIALLYSGIIQFDKGVSQK